MQIHLTMPEPLSLYDLPARRASLVDTNNPTYPVKTYTIFDRVEARSGLALAGPVIPLGQKIPVPNCRYCPDRLAAQIDKTAPQDRWNDWGHSYLAPSDVFNPWQSEYGLHPTTCEFCYHFSALHEDVKNEILTKNGECRSNLEVFDIKQLLKLYGIEAEMTWQQGILSYNNSKS